MLLSLCWYHSVDVTLLLNRYMVEQNLHCKKWQMHQPNMTKKNSAFLTSNVHMKFLNLSYLNCWYCQQRQSLQGSIKDAIARTNKTISFSFNYRTKKYYGSDHRFIWTDNLFCIGNFRKYHWCCIKYSIVSVSY